MDNDDPDAVAAMLEFLYTADYSYDISVALKPPDHTEHAMTWHLQVYALADKLQIQDLKSLAQESFEEVVKEHWDHPAFPLAIRSVYAIAPPGLGGTELREIVLKISTAHASELFTATDSFANMMEQVAEFGKDLSVQLAKQCAAVSQALYKMDDPRCHICWVGFGKNLKLLQELEYLTCPACGAFH